MNSQGRHYRDQGDPTNPVCDYESRGQKCEFYATNEDFALLPYPNDISLGPSPQNESRSSEFAQILELLQQQKQDSDRQIASIQEQVNQLALSRAPASSSGTIPTQSLATAQASVTAIPTVTATLTGSRVTAQSTLSAPMNIMSPARQGQLPQYVTNAGTSLNSHLNSGLGHSHNLGYQSLTLN